MSKKEFDIFVPGRLCLFGEHSDWAGGHRRQNSEIEKGYAIVAPTNQGNYARVKRLDEPLFRFVSEPIGKSLEAKMESGKLREIAEEGKIFSYAAGVACEIISSYEQFKGNGGLEIINYKTNLPIKKGLSSSASICVLVAKAFNQIYDLGFTNRRIMELAYLGETTTPSRCGKLDQACAYEVPVLMTFDSDQIKVEKLKLGGNFYFLIVDLNKGKDTTRILSDLNEGFPWPRSEIEIRKHEYFKLNKKIVEEAKDAFEEGNLSKLGEIMRCSQQYFDDYLAPSCEELKAPALHSLLNSKDIAPFIFGGKGVGSGGDGTAQLLCKSSRDKQNVKRILAERGLNSMELSLKKKE
jgi:galactokinase